MAEKKLKKMPQIKGNVPMFMIVKQFITYV